jgi:hypothetical protein
MAAVHVRYRAQFAYVEAELTDGDRLPLMRLRYGGSAHRWGTAIYTASTNSYEDQTWFSGSPKKPSTSSATYTSAPSRPDHDRARHRSTPKDLDRVSVGVVAGQQVESGCAAVADQSAGQAQESEVVGSLALVAANQAPEPGGPFQAAFDDVAVSAEPFRRLDPFAGDPRDDVARPQQFASPGIVVALVACSLPGLFRGRPTGCRTGLMPSTTSWSIRWSLTLAAEMSTCSGNPRRSPTAWILEPGLPPSTVLGPVRFPF